MPNLHSLLERQLKRIGITEPSQPPQQEAWQELLDRVSQTYRQSEEDRYRIERSLEISSREMQEQIAERNAAEAALKKAHDELTVKHQQLVRVNEFFRAAVEQMTSAINHGANSKELLEHLRLMEFEFERLDHQKPNGH
jgi:hypothetical protein